MEWLEPLMRADVVTWRVALTSIVLSFVLTQALAGVYLWTFRGLSYSRSFVQTVALASIVVCTLMLAIGNSVAAGIGVAGGLSIVRFRISLRDPRDILFIFAALAAGIACGLQAYAAAILGVLVFCAATLVLHLMSYGVRREFDGLVRFAAPASADAEEAIAQALRQHCLSFVLVTLRAAAQGSYMEHAYQISIPDPAARARLVSALRGIAGVQDVSLLLQEPTLDL